MQAGQTISHYKLERRLGAGGMGEVWLADDTRLQRSVAIKFISPLLGSDSEIADRFLREARAAAKLGHHPHVVPVHELGESDGSTFIVMDYVEGESLRDVLGREGGNVPILDALRWGQEIADGLSEAHRAGITHRDIKPDNILLDRKRSVRIADFGLARLASSTQLTRTGAGMGTLKYMSPEQATGKDVDHRTDLFSLGATLYELLAGEPAFQGDDPPALVYAVAHTEPKPLAEYRDDLPSPLVELVEAMLQKDPGHRPQSAEVVARELGKMKDAIARGEPVEPLALDVPPDMTVPLTGTPFPARKPAPPGLKGAPLKLIAGIVIVSGLAWGASQIVDRSSDPAAPAGTAPVATAAEGNHRLAIFPFAFEGDPESAHLAGDVAGMLDFVFEGTGDFSIVKTDSLLQHIEDQGLDATQPGVAEQLAGEFGANRYITGTLSTAGAGFRVDAQLRSSSGTVLLEARERANQESEFQQMTDRLGLKLLEGLFDAPTDGIRLVALKQATSVEAIKEFLRGVTFSKSYWGTPQALEAFRRAVDLDSTFALAHFKIATQIIWSTNGDLIAGRPSALKAFQNREGLPDAYQLVLEGLYRETQGEIDRAEQLYRTSIQLIPNSIDVNQRLAACLWLHNAVRGRSPTEAIPYLERIFEFDPDYPGILISLGFAYCMANDMINLERAVVKKTKAPPDTYWQYQFACAGDDRERQEALADSLAHFSRMHPLYRDLLSLRIRAVPDNHWNVLAHYERMPDSLMTTLDRLLVDLTRGLAEAGLGRWSKASAWFDGIHPDFALQVAEHKALAMAIPVLELPEEEIRDMIETLRTWPRSDPGIVFGMENSMMSASRFEPHFDIHPHIRLYLLALLHAKIGELETAREYARDLDVLPASSLAVENRRVGAWATIAYTEGDYQAALDRLDSIVNRTVSDKYALFANRTWEVFLRGLVLSRLGRGRQALPWFQRQPTEFAFALDAPGHLERARIYDELGEVDNAVEYYTRFIDLWRDADPPLQPLVEEARDRLAALSS